MSPQGVYTQSSNPPEGWTAAPAPSQIEVIAASGGNPPRVIIRWADNDIKNRWLRVTIKSNEDTGLFNDEIFYAGHLLGEVTGASSGVYTVSSTDFSTIAGSVGQSAGVSNILDIDKNGTISYADISASTPNSSVQQENIATAVNPLADLTHSQVWDLDALGNFGSLTNNDGSAVTRTHNLQNQVTGVGSASLSFDANGNMTVDEQGRTFIWDAWNRLVEVKEGSTTLVEYQYDGLKRRIVEDDGTTEIDLYYSAQWQVLEERVGGDTTVQYVWSAVYVDAMILRDRDADANTGNGLEERIYVLHDANYNVTAIAYTDGDVLERYYYEAYGRAVYLDGDFELLPDGQSDHGWQHLHQGGRLDSAAGNYHFRHRDLSPTQGRWTSQDPIGFEAGDANLYRYVGDGPTGLLDPIGLEVYWMARDLDGVPFENHGALVLVPDNPEDFRGEIRLMDLYDGRRGVTIGAYKGSTEEGDSHDGKLVVRFRSKADVAAAREYFDEDRYRKSKDKYKSGWSADLHEVPTPVGSTDTEFIREIIDRSRRYRSHHEQVPDYRLGGPNCQTWINTVLSCSGVPNDVRIEAGEFDGWDWGEEELIDDGLFQ